MAGIERLLRPRTIAVIGGGAWGASVIEECRKIGFEGAIWPVHPTREQVAGVRSWRSIKDLPEPPDAAFVGVNRMATIEAVEALALRGAGGAVCFASGFRESLAQTGDGADLQARLLQVAGDMPILGPNCYGLINALDGVALWPDQHGARRVERGVAIVTQSSNISINLTMQQRGVPLAYMVTAGNQAQLGIAEIGLALLEDPRVTVLGLHIEGMGDLRALEVLAARAEALGKPIVALKVGRSEQAQAATVSHTASLAGSNAGAQALLARLGIGRASGLGVFLEALKLLHVAGPLGSNRIASMSCSGGEASLMADAALGTGLVFPPLVHAQEQSLRAALGAHVALANPLDYHTYIWGDQAAIARCFTAMMQGDLALGLVVLDFPRSDRCDGGEWNKVVTAVTDAQAATGRPMAVISTLADTMPEDRAQAMVAQGIVPLCGVEDGLGAVALAASLGRRVDVPLLQPARPARAGLLSEEAAKAMLAAHGCDTPRAESGATPDQAAEAAAKIGGPVVLKGLGAAHKTEAGLVALDLNADQVAARARQMSAAKGFLIEEMITGAHAELIVGVVSDPAHGMVLTLGAGGTLTEILRDTVSLLLPVTASDIRAALGQLRIAPLLAGYRGASGADEQAVIKAVLAVQATVLAHEGAIEEIEINPLICTPTRAVAADALIRIGEPQ